MKTFYLKADNDELDKFSKILFMNKGTYYKGYKKQASVDYYEYTVDGLKKLALVVSPQKLKMYFEAIREKNIGDQEKIEAELQKLLEKVIF